MRNINYKTEEISNFFKKNRIKWNHLYLSEKKSINYIFNNSNIKTVLDVGCACGGLGSILKKKFKIKEYTGIEINKNAALIAQKKHKNIFNKDFLNFNTQKKFDLSVSLSCIDWQNNFQKMLNKLWSHTKNNGYMLLTSRLTEDKTMNSINKSFQYINYHGQKYGEKAPYVVFNFSEFLSIIKLLGPEEIYVNGYYGQPSYTAVTPYKKIFFCGVVVKKSNKINNEITIKIPKEFII